VYIDEKYGSTLQDTYLITYRAEKEIHQCGFQIIKKREFIENNGITVWYTLDEPDIELKIHSFSIQTPPFITLDVFIQDETKKHWYQHRLFPSIVEEWKKQWYAYDSCVLTFATL
jgi:hypothetical protein